MLASTARATNGQRSLMTAVAALVMAFVVSATPVRAADFVVQSLDFDFPNEVQTSAADGKNVVIMFVLDGCPYCAKMHKRVFPHPEVNAFYSEHFNLIEVDKVGDLDVVTPQGEAMIQKDFADKMRVRATPVFVYLGKDGEEALRLTGYQDVGMFNAAGRYVSSEAYKDGTSFLSFVRAGK